MNVLKFITDECCGKIKKLHGVNNGPAPHKKTQTRDNFDSYKEACIPYARLHDSGFWTAIGGPNVVNITAIFPDFSKNPEDPEAYDFFYTDKYIESIIAAGAEPFYRLGEDIEHGEKKYRICPPKDPDKWASICEHIISHYTEGWANGFHHKIEYWEIWNEPDCKDRSMWIGTQEDFFTLYEKTATRLKNKFPHLKIGGPALSQTAFHDLTWGTEFVKYMASKNVPLDFLSWHTYADNTEEFVNMANDIRALLDKNGYDHTESILNEYNYLKDWTDNFTYSIKQIIGTKGAAFEAAVMSAGQNSSIDLLMYYDARPGGFNGLFDYYTYEPLKGYYPFKMFSELYKLGNQIPCEHEMKNIYALGAKNDVDEYAFMITRYECDDTVTDTKEIEIIFSGLKNRKFLCFVVDSNRNQEVEPVMTDENGKLTLSMEPNCCYHLKTM